MLALVVALLLGAPPDATPPSPNGAGATPRTVYRLDPVIDGAIMAGAALVISVPTLLASDIIRERCPCDPSGINALDRGAVGNHNAFADVTSDVTAVAAIIAPPLLDLVDLGTGQAFYTDGLVFAETLLVNGALTEIAKYTVQRPLPRTYAGDPSLVSQPGGYRSFYSGHTSTVFAALGASAMTLRLRYGERVWPWVVTGAVGASVAVERVEAGRHFPTDVMVGALAGAAVGILVPWLHATSPALTLTASGRSVGVAGRF